MPYIAREIEKTSACGDSYTDIEVILSDEWIESENQSAQLSPKYHSNIRMLDPDWDEIPF